MTELIRQAWQKIGSLLFCMMIVLLVRGAAIVTHTRSRHAKRRS